MEPGPAQTQLAALAEHMNRSEPQTASIDTPLAHEAAIATEQQLEHEPRHEQANAHELEPEEDVGWEL